MYILDEIKHVGKCLTILSVSEQPYQCIIWLTNLVFFLQLEYMYNKKVLGLHFVELVFTYFSVWNKYTEWNKKSPNILYVYYYYICCTVKFYLYIKPNVS